MTSIETILGIMLTLKDEASAGLGKAGEGLSGLMGRATEAGAKFLVLKESLSQIGQMAMAFVDKSVNFDSAVQRAAIRLDIEGTAVDDLRDQIRGLADDTLGGIYTSQACASAFQAMAEEGWGVAGTLEMVKNAMNLAAATGDDLSSTASGLEGVIEAFGLKAGDSAHITDVLLNTFKATGASIPTLTSSLASMGQIVTGLGMSLEETTAMIGVFRDVGVDGMNGLLIAFSTLTDANSKQSQALAEMGISALDLAGNLKSPVTLIQELSSAGMDATQILELFGVRGSRAMIAALNNINTIAQVTAGNINSTGEAAKAAGQYSESSAGKTEKMKVAWDELQLTLSETLMPAMTALFEVLKPIMDIFSKYPELIYLVIGAFVAWKVVTLAQTVATWASTAATWASNVALYANPIILIIMAIIALVAAIYLLVTNWDAVTKAVGDFAKGAGDAIGGFFDWCNDGLANLGDSIGNAGQSIQDFFGGIGESISNYFGGLWDDFVNWGRHMIEGFCDGIRQGISGIGDAIGNVGSNIQKFLGFSRPPEKGPLHHVPDWGRHMVQSYMEGMMDELPTIERKLSLATQPIIEKGTAYSYATTDNRQRVVNLTQNIYHADEDRIARKVFELMEGAIGA